MNAEYTIRIFITGATGYIGGRLGPALLDAGYEVRVLVHDPNRLEGRIWMPEVEDVKGDMMYIEREI